MIKRKVRKFFSHLHMRIRDSKYCHEYLLISSYCILYPLDIAKLADYLKTLTQLVKKFVKDTRTTANEANLLSAHMRDGFKSSNLEQDFIPIMTAFGDVFGEMASAQELLGEILTQNLVVPIEKFYNETISTMFQLKQQYMKERERHDDKIIRYLQSDSSSAFIRGSQSNQVEYRAMDVVSHRKNLELIRFDLVRQINEVEAKKSFELSETCISSMVLLRSAHRACADRIDNLTNFTSEYSNKQGVQRQVFMDMKQPLDRQRSSIAAVLDTMIERVDNQIPQTSADVPTNRDSSIGFDTANSSSNNLSGLAMDEFNSSSSSNNMMGTISKIGAMGVAMGANWITNFKRGSDASSKKSYPSTPSSNNLSISSDSNPADSSAAVPFPSPTISNSNQSSCYVEDTEMRMKVLDKSELEPFYTRNINESFPNVIKQGYVLEKGTGKLLQTVWNRRWLVLDDAKLIMVKEGYDMHEPLGIQVLCEIILASVREVRNPELPYCFELAYANMKTYTFQAEGPKEYHQWIDAIRSAIEKRLIAGPNSSSTSVSSSKHPMPSSSMLQLQSSNHALKLQDVDLIMKSNPRCCECNKNDPDWVALNLGCLICIDCSGVHRSLGVHLSKVRSLTLDDLEPEEYEVIKRLGNNVNQEIWEASLMSSAASTTDERAPSPSPMASAIRKPSAKDDYATRDRYIRAKYVTKEYLADRDKLLPPALSRATSAASSSSSSESESSEASSMRRELSIELLKACMRDDCTTLLRLLALGAPVNGDPSIDPSAIIANDGSADSMESYLPLLVAAQYGSISSVVLLALNGADLAAGNVNASSTAAIRDIFPCITIAKKYKRSAVVNYLHRKAELLGILGPALMSKAPNQVSLDSPVSATSEDSGFDSGAGPSPHLPQQHRSSNSQAHDMADIGERLRQASESSTAGALLEKLVSTDILSVDMLKKEFAKVLTSVGEVGDEIMNNISASISLDEEPEPLSSRRISIDSIKAMSSPRASVDLTPAPEDTSPSVTSPKIVMSDAERPSAEELQTEADASANS
jgi:hypothetical protein